MTDKELLEIYLLGFNNELDGIYNAFQPKEKNSLEYKAYNLGGLHAIVGDDIRSFDYLSDEEILKMIRQ